MQKVLTALIDRAVTETRNDELRDQIAVLAGRLGKRQLAVRTGQPPNQRGLAGAVEHETSVPDRVIHRECVAASAGLP